MCIQGAVQGDPQDWWACSQVFCPFPILAYAEVGPPFSLLADVSGAFILPPPPLNIVLDLQPAASSMSHVTTILTQPRL